MFVPTWLLITAALGAAILIGLLIARGGDARRDDMMGPPRTRLGEQRANVTMSKLPANDLETRMAQLALDPEIRMAMESGNKIGAIKLVREKTGLGLKEAKDLVEAL